MGILLRLLSQYLFNGRNRADKGFRSEAFAQQPGAGDKEGKKDILCTSFLLTDTENIQ